VEQVLEATLPTFQSVDVRTLSFSLDGGLCNLVTTIGFNAEPASILEQDLQASVRPEAEFGDNRLQFRFKVVPTSNWSQLLEEFKRGVVDYHGESVNMMAEREISTSTGYLGTFNSFNRFSQWPVFESHVALRPAQHNDDAVRRIARAQHDLDLRRNLSAHGHHSLKTVCQALFQLGSDRELAYESGIYIAIPVFAAVRQLRFNPAEQRLSAKVECHPHLQPNVRVFGDAALLPRGEYRLQFSAPELWGDEGWVASAQCDAHEGIAGVNVWLSHRELGSVTSKITSLKDIVPPIELNPLWQLLQVFCPSETFGQLLTAPPKGNDKRHKEQRTFEQYVGWLLAIHGFSVVVLGEFETLRAQGSSVQQGSLDILAYHAGRKKVLLGSCTLAPPEERDYGNLVNLRSHLNSYCGAVTFDIELAIFTTAAECVPPSHYAGSGSDIVVFDRRDLKNAVQALNEGGESMFFEKLNGTFRSVWGVYEDPPLR
jgi:hypothetical protein